MLRGGATGERGTHRGLTGGEEVQRPLDRAASLCRACRAPGDLS